MSGSRPGSAATRGFTLVEVLTALVVLGAVLLVGLSGLQAGLSSRADATEYAALRTLAEQKLAALRSLPGPGLRRRVGEATGGFPGLPGGASWRVVVQELDPRRPPLALDPASGPAARGSLGGSGLFLITVDVRRGPRRFEVTSHVDRSVSLRQAAARGAPRSPP